MTARTSHLLRHSPRAAIAARGRPSAAGLILGMTLATSLVAVAVVALTHLFAA